MPTEMQKWRGIIEGKREERYEKNKRVTNEIKAEEEKFHEERRQNQVNIYPDINM